MGYSLIKYLESAGDLRRAFFYLDRGESDLPPTYDIAPGSEAVSRSSGQRWFLNSKYKWTPWDDGSGGTTAGEPIIDKVEIFPKEIVVNNNSEVQFSYILTGDKAIDNPVKWEVLSGKGVGTMISPEGLLVVGQFTKQTVMTVRVSSIIDPTKFEDATVTVDAYDYKQYSELISLDIKPDIFVSAKERTIQLVPHFTYYGNCDFNLNWSVQNATDTTVDSNGVVTIGPNETAKTFVIRAESSAKPEVYDASVVVIEDDASRIPIVDSVEIKPKNMAIAPGSFAILNAEVSGVNDPSNDIVWSIVAVSDNTEISSDGILVIGEDEPDGQIEITARSAQDYTKFDTVIYDVDVTAPKTQQVLDIIVKPADSVIIKPNIAVFEAKVLGINLQSAEVNWSVQKNTSNFTAIKSNGILEIASEETAPAIIVLATSKSDTTKFGVATVTVKSPAEGDDSKYAPEVQSTPRDTYYVRGVDSKGNKIWRVIDVIPEAPTDKVGAQYVRKTTEDGTNIWAELESNGIETMTAEEWNALDPEKRPEFAYISNHWLHPQDDMIILDANGNLII